MEVPDQGQSESSEACFCTRSRLAVQAGAMPQCCARVAESPGRGLVRTEFPAGFDVESARTDAACPSSPIRSFCSPGFYEQDVDLWRVRYLELVGSTGRSVELRCAGRGWAGCLL